MQTENKDNDMWLGTAGSEGTGEDVWKQQTEMSLFKC